MTLKSVLLPFLFKRKHRLDTCCGTLTAFTVLWYTVETHFKPSPSYGVLGLGERSHGNIAMQFANALIAECPGKESKTHL